MDVRCERCKAQYVLDDDQVTAAGVALRCTNCGHLFKVKKKELVVTVPVKPGDVERTPLPASAAAPRAGGTTSPAVSTGAAPAGEPERPREWRIRTGNGEIFTFRELTTLQRWVVERRVGREDELSQSGEQWKRLGDIAGLATFFEVVEAAERSRAQAQPAITPVPPVTPQPVPVHEVDLVLEEPPGRRRVLTRPGLWVPLALVAVGAGAYAVAPRLLTRPQPPPPQLEPAPVVEGKPTPPPEPPSLPAPPPEASPAPPPEAPPAPAPAPEAAVEAAPAPPVPASVAPPQPRGPKALLARAKVLLEKGKAPAALELYGRVASDDPENVEALTGRGLCYLDLENGAPAEASFQAALRLQPEYADALLGLAETYRYRGKKAEAVAAYERYLARYPGGEEAEVAKNALSELRK